MRCVENLISQFELLAAYSYYTNIRAYVVVAVDNIGDKQKSIGSWAVCSQIYKLFSSVVHFKQSGNVEPVNSTAISYLTAPIFDTAQILRAYFDTLPTNCHVSISSNNLINETHLQMNT
jgi:hypothetical protein